jgi:multiple sugar transport system substrate-binding protein
VDAPTGSSGETPDVAASAPRELSGTVTFVYGAFAPPAKWESYFKEFLAANPGVTIKYVPVSLDDGWGAYSQKIASLVASGQKLDVVWVASEGVPALASRNVLSPLDDYIARDKADQGLQDYLSDVSPTLMDALKWDGKTVADPGWFTSSPWYITNGTSILNDGDTQAQLDAPAAIESIKFLYDLVHTHRVAPQPPVVAEDLFQAGKVAMFGGGRWPLESFVAGKFTSFEIVPFPRNKSAGTVVGSDGYGRARSTQNSEAAWALIKYLGSKQVMQTLVGADTVSGSIPARRSLATDAAMAPPNNFKYSYDSLESAKPVSAGAHYPELSTIYSRYMSSLMARETTVDAAARPCNPR